MRYTYPAIIHDDSDGFWCEFPDLAGCFTQGDSLGELLFNAEEALEGYLLARLDHDLKITPASDIRSLKSTASTYPTLISVDLDLSKLSKAIKKTVSIPAWMNERAMAKGFNFSQILQEGIIAKLAGC